MVQPRNQMKLYFLTGGVCAIALGIRLLPLLRSGDEWALMPDSFKYIALDRSVFPAAASGDGRGYPGYRVERKPGLDGKELGS